LKVSEGIDRLAGAFLPEVAELVQQTGQHRKWAKSEAHPQGSSQIEK